MRVDKRGRIFHAVVQGLGAAGGFAVAPIERNVTYRQVNAREIIDHWAHAGRDRSEDPAVGQISFDDLLAT